MKTFLTQTNCHPASQAAREAIREGATTGSVYDTQLVPAVDIYQKGETYYVEAELPGADKTSIDVGVKDFVLTIKAEAKRAERTVRYERQIRLSDWIDQDAISADYKNGVLSLQLPKSAAAKNRKIDIQF